jgi:hypothetical protein
VLDFDSDSVNEFIVLKIDVAGSTYMNRVMGSDDGLGHLWGRSLDDGVESVDIVSGVGDSSDGTVRLDKGVLSLDDISVSGLVGGLLVSGESVSDRVSVVVLWMRVVWLWSGGCKV